MRMHRAPGNIACLPGDDSYEVTRDPVIPRIIPRLVSVFPLLAPHRCYRVAATSIGFHVMVNFPARRRNLRAYPLRRIISVRFLVQAIRALLTGSETSSRCLLSDLLSFHVAYFAHFFHAVDNNRAVISGHNVAHRLPGCFHRWACSPFSKEIALEQISDFKHHT